MKDIEIENKLYTISYQAYNDEKLVVSGTVDVELDECQYLLISDERDSTNELRQDILMNNVYGYIDEDINENFPDLSIGDLEYKVEIEGEVRFKLPTSKEECFRILEELEKEAKDETEEGDDDDFMVNEHFGLGLWIRNNWIYGRGNKVLQFFDYDFPILMADFASDTILNEYHEYKKKQQSQ